MNKVLVTGGNGFIGRYTVRELLKADREVMVLDPHLGGMAHELNPDVEVYAGDIRDSTAVMEVMAHVDGFIHLAGVLGTQETIKNPIPAAETNIIGGLNIFKAAAQYDVPGVNIAVGNWWMQNTYSISKNCAERFAQMFNKEAGTSIQVVRALNAYGPEQLAATPYGPGKVRKIIPAFVCRALTATPIEIYGKGSQIMDMVYVVDVARALYLALVQAEAGNIPMETYLAPDDTYQERQLIIEIGSGRSTTVTEIADVVVDAVRRLGYDAPPHEYLPMRPGEPEASVVLGDPSTLEFINMDPGYLVPLDAGIDWTVKNFVETLGSKWFDPR